MAKEYDYLLKVLLVGDSDVGKTEILNNLDDDLNNEEGKIKIIKKQKFFCKSLISICFQQHIRQQSFY
jgi:ABC-type nitrate/sulfonate/bicarbonate transport system ATPase subunit